MSATQSPGRSPRRTVRLGDPDPVAASTDYAVGPAVRSAPATAPDLRPARVRSTLDADARQLFRHRLALCCLIAAGPFLLFFLCSLTNFIELFGRATVGTAGAVLLGGTVAALLAAATVLFRVRSLDEQSLRVLEIAVFGLMAICFAYWQFMVLTSPATEPVEADRRLVPAAPVRPAAPSAATAEPSAEAVRQAQTAALAAAVIVHFNWFALIVFHGVLVPNSPARGAGITLGMALAALLITAVAARVHGPTGAHAGPVFAVSVTLLAVGAGLSIFGTAKTEALRREVLVAREAVRELGQYRLKRKLGHGGMGEVYLAEHHLLKRPCALKRIHPRYLNNPEQVRRFEREVQATAQLRHPNTVEIYDYGRADDGTFYYVMEYLPGLSLEDLVGKYGPLPAERVVHLLAQVCGALAEAHRHGMVHRDIKPSNVVVFPDGSPHDQVKVVDFGLVHSLADDLEPDRKITREGLIVGTPEYMSPEQASGGALDGRSDLFSLGSVAYFLLTGREVFHRDNPMKTLLAVVNDPPPPVVQYAPLTPPDVRKVLKTCLAKDPADRFASAADLARALAACASFAAWTPARAADWWATHTGGAPDFGTDISTLPLPPDSGPGGPVVAGRGY